MIAFRIKSIGEFSNVNREIEAVVYDFSGAASAVASQLQQEALEAINPGAQKPKNTNKTKDPLPKGPPRIVYFIER